MGHALPQSDLNWKYRAHRRFQLGCQNEVLRAALTDLANTLREQGEVENYGVLYQIVTFASAKGGGAQIGPT